MTAVDMSDIYGSTDVNEAFNKFNLKITKCFNESFPVVQLSRKRQKDKKWITKSLKKSAYHKNMLYKKWIKTKDLEDKEKYIRYKKILRYLLMRLNLIITGNSSILEQTALNSYGPI